MNTTLPFLKLFNSTSSYFDQNMITLTKNRELVRKYLEDIKGYSPEQSKIYLTAYDYFVVNPLHYDGATMTEDLYDIENLELASMLHDYLYIEYNAAGSFKYCLLSDKLFRNEMTRMNKSSWNRGARFVLLLLKSLIGYTFYAYLFRNRRMTDSQKISMDGIITTLSHRIPKIWYKEFKGEITFVGFLIVLFIFVLY